MRGVLPDTPEVKNKTKPTLTYNKHYIGCRKIIMNTITMRNEARVTQRRIRRDIQSTTAF